MDTNDELREQMRTFHTHLTELYRLHQQTIARRYFASLQPEPTRVEKAAARIRPLLVRGRRFLSRQLHAVAQVVDPDPGQPRACTDEARADYVVDTSVL